MDEWFWMDKMVSSENPIVIFISETTLSEIWSVSWLFTPAIFIKIEHKGKQGKLHTVKALLLESKAYCAEIT